MTVIAFQGKQFKVAVGQPIWVDQLDLQPQSEIIFDQVLMINDHFGRPYLKDARVKGEVVKHTLGKKIVVFKYKPKKGYHKKQGHRQPYTQVMITAISLTGQFLKKQVVASTTTVDTHQLQSDQQEQEIKSSVN